MQLDKDKQKLFAGATSYLNPTLSIQSVRSINQHLIDTRILMNESVDKIKAISEGVKNTSYNLQSTDNIYNNCSNEMRKAGIFITEISKKEASNAFKIRASFFIFLAVCVYVILRRIFFRNLYKWN